MALDCRPHQVRKRADRQALSVVNVNTLDMAQGTPRASDGRVVAGSLPYAWRQPSVALEQMAIRASSRPP